MNTQYTIIWLTGILVLNLLLVPTVMAFNASVDSVYLYDSNVYKTRDEVSSNVMKVSPKISTGLKYKGYALTGLYSLDRARYVELPEQDYLKQNLSVGFSSDKLAKYSAIGGYSYISSIDPRGRVDNTSTNTTTSPDQWVSNASNASVRYRTDDNKISYKLSFSNSRKRYSIEDSKIKDVDSNVLEFENAYILTGKSNLRYSIIRTSAKYPFSGLGATQFDSLDMSYLLGFTWKTSGKINATADAGWKTKKNIETGDTIFSDTVANIRIEWEKKSYSKYTLGLGRSIKTRPELESNNSVLNTMSMDWKHTFTRQFSTNIGLIGILTQHSTGESDRSSTIKYSLSYKANRRLGISHGMRWESLKSTGARGSSDKYTLSAGLEYKVTRWFDISPSLSWITFNSTDVKRVYDNYVVSIQFRLKYLR